MPRGIEGEPAKCIQEKDNFQKHRTKGKQTEHVYEFSITDINVICKVRFLEGWKPMWHPSEGIYACFYLKINDYLKYNYFIRKQGQQDKYLIWIESEITQAYKFYKMKKGINAFDKKQFLKI